MNPTFLYLAAVYACFVLVWRRLATPGHAFGPDTPWQHEVEEAFPFEETPDQHAAIHARLPAVCVLGGCCGTDARHVAEVHEPAAEPSVSKRLRLNAALTRLEACLGKVSSGPRAPE